MSFYLRDLHILIFFSEDVISVLESFSPVQTLGNDCTSILAFIYLFIFGDEVSL